MKNNTGMSRVFLTAAVAVGGVVVVALWQVFGGRSNIQNTVSFTATSPTHNIPQADASWMADIAGVGTHQPNATSSTPTQIAALGQNIVGQLLFNMSALKRAGIFATDTVVSMIHDVASSTKPAVAHRVYTYADIATTSNTTYTRVLTYRADLQRTLKPLLKNTANELELYGNYSDTKDPNALAALRAAAINYYKAASTSAGVVVPFDAVTYQLDMLNALEEFGAVLDAMADNVNDPLVSVTLLRSYNQAEEDVYRAFDGLASYYRLKQAT